jgi:hypothetical protein
VQVLELLPDDDMLEVPADVARVLLQLLSMALQLPVHCHRTRAFCVHVVGSRHVVRTVLGATLPSPRVPLQLLGSCTAIAQRSQGKHCIQSNAKVTRLATSFNPNDVG